MKSAGLIYIGVKKIMKKVLFAVMSVICLLVSPIVVLGGESGDSRHVILGAPGTDSYGGAIIPVGDVKTEPTVDVATPALVDVVAAPVVTETPKPTVPAPAVGDTTVIQPPETVDGAVQTGSAVLQAVKSGNWPLAVGFAIMLLIFLFRKFIEKMVPKSYLAWVALGLGVLTTVASGLIAGQTWYAALVQGVLSGATATGLYELILKHLPKKSVTTTAQ